MMGSGCCGTILGRSRKGWACAIALAASLGMLCAATSASAATYYVDPATGADTNSGTSPSSPWKTPPGTRTASNSGFLQSGWGSVTSANKIKCGDTILLKGGSTHTNSQGGSWKIDPTYYTTNCTTGSRITFRVASSAGWSGSTGAFTIDGSGITPASDASMDKHSLVLIVNVNFVELKGLSAGQRFIVRDSTEFDVLLWATSTGTGFRGDWWELRDSELGFNIGPWNNWQVSNAIGHNIKRSPFQTGQNNDWKVNQAGLVDVESYDSGCGSIANPGCTNGSGNTDLFFLIGGTGLWCVRCQAHGGGERGLNTGVVQNANMGGDYSYRFRDWRAWNNGASCQPTGPHYCVAGGWDVSGNQNVNSNRSRNYVLGGIAFGHDNLGFSAYQSATVELWNVVTYATSSSHGLDTTMAAYGVFNSIDVRARSGDAAFSRNTSGGQSDLNATPVVRSSCLRPLSANSETLGASGWPGAGTYTSPPAWIDNTNKTGLTNCNPLFVATNTSTYASNDFHLQAGSTAIDAGRFVLLANGAGSNATTVTVKANGGTGDPRNYFIAPDSFLDAPADTIQIEGCGRVTITGMTATSISFTPGCSWANGAGIHLPWAGSAPDMGAFEYGLQGGGPPAPTLLSVQPIP